MTEWTALTLDSRVDSEIEALPIAARAKLMKIIELMKSEGPENVREPHCKPLREKLWEMRMAGPYGIARAIYVLAPGRRIVVLHAFVKKTQKTPASAIRLALKRAEEIST